MGADIHMYAEVRNTEGAWEKVGDVFDNPYYDPDQEIKIYEDGYTWNAPKIDHPYDMRNYPLFALLADVRNGYGFAGVITHEPVKPLFANRGVPRNASNEYKALIKGWDVDAHSPSYATLAELQAVDWSSIGIRRVGFLDTDEYERIRGTDLLPDTWCGGASGPFVQKITADVYEREYRNVIEDKAANREEMMSIYIYWQWFETFDLIAEDFIKSFDILATLGKPEDVRVVFFFDS